MITKGIFNMSDIILTQEQLQKLVNGVMKGATAGPAVGISRDKLENLYALGNGLYTSGNFKDAHVIFQALCIYDSNDYRFWMGLAGSRQAMEDYEKAIDAYQMAAVATSLHNPEPFLYAARCLLKLGRKEDAIVAIEGLLTLGSKEDPRVVACHEKAKALLTHLQAGS